MLSWAFTFFMLAVAAALFGFGGVVPALASVMKIFFVVFLGLSLGSLLLQLAGRLERRDKLGRNISW